MAERIKLIDPACEVMQIEDFVEPGNFDATLGARFDYVVDAIDSVRTKTPLSHGVSSISSRSSRWAARVGSSTRRASASTISR